MDEFVTLHQVQLLSSNIPEHLWESLYLKLKLEVMSSMIGLYEPRTGHTGHTGLMYQHVAATPNINKLHAPAALVQEPITRTPYRY